MGKLALSQANLQEVSLRTELETLRPFFCSGIPWRKAGQPAPESVVNESFRGVSLGVSVPLWNDRNRVKAAKAGISVARAEEERYRSEQHKELSQLLVRRQSALQKISVLETALMKKFH